MRPTDIRYVVVHCSDSKWGDVDEIRKWHHERGWDDVGYHYVVCNQHPRSSKTAVPESDGRVQAGRSLTRAGAHAVGYNTRSVGVCLIGKGEADFTPAQLNALRRLVKELQRKFNIPTENVIGHYETYAKGKPPAKSCPNMDMGKFRASLRRAP